MSNAKAIAAVTATLRRTLQTAVNAEIGAAKVTTLRPDTLTNATPAPSVNIYLYQATSNSVLRNIPLPTRNGAGGVMQRPRAALTLHYLISFYGSEADLEPQRLFGAVARTLESRPLITRQAIKDMLTDAAFAFLAGANLADEPEVVRLTPQPLTLEELSKIWSVFFQTPYTLSAAYQAGVVLLEADETPREALPVRERTITVLPFRSPEIEQIVSELGAGLPILSGATISVRGRQLRGEVTHLGVGGEEVVPGDIADDVITAVLPTTLRAGVHSLHVVQKLKLGKPPADHPSFESNVVAFALAPRITSVTGLPGKVRLVVDPIIRAAQRPVLLVNSATTDRAERVDLGPLPADNATLEFPIGTLPTGNYYVRVRIDGAESSLLDLNPASPTFKQAIAPQLTI